ncbi:SDR family oxidoreductase [Streptomyces fimicarius]|uniref:SDR family oxidoreductase n=1 Tax=Streptomyces TaxID=1883 RepID=UPI0004AB11B8|nr:MULTISPECIES: NAD(P)H-binding protein [Streptomyces]MCX4710397.1 NAD(P)H-binding protein [Streptomyces griseus]MDX2669195.1 NAD(P)H-binding protein [Streptomyces sp. NRRL_ISP-5395]WKN16180.1 NAD(P)H-binding protein [Streptomyces sp. JUS-F4]GHF92207.1 NmrA family transcriptional regulator [Streptomyces griseus]
MIVVTGATGNVGRTLVPLLAEAGEEVVAVSRQPHPAGLPAGARHARADVGDAASMAPVLEGADAFFVLLGGELNGRGERPKALLDAAVAAGVKRVVLLSSQVGATRPEELSHARLREFEAAVRTAGPDFTVLRPGGFASNAFAWAESVRTRRTVFAPFGDVALPVIDPADIAAVAAAALSEDGHAGRTYELTGPEAISPRRQAAVISEALGEEVAFVELSREEAHEHLARFMPEEVIGGTLDVLGLPLPAEQAVGSDVESVLRRPARPFGEWVARNLPAFR